MKKLLFFLLLLLIAGAAVAAWLLMGPGTGFDANKETVYIRSNAANKAAVMDSLRSNNIVKNEKLFTLLADRMDYWQLIKPGKYEIEKGSSVLSIVRKLRNGQQTPVNLTITKVRTKEDLVRLVSRRMEVDSAQMLQYIDSNEYLREKGLNAEQAMTLVLPDTYTYFWNATPQTIFGKLAEASEKFWNGERLRKAAALNITPEQAYIIASIVEEESNKLEEKDTIASVYLNRLRIGMPLQADPTVKFALKDFALTRIYGEHLNAPSPYNTYRNKGLPPGPICTPSRKTIDEVLAAPKTDYIYFVAHPDLNGTHSFSSSYAEHQRKARAYQQAYKEWAAKRNVTSSQ
ncbi:MAG: endolytic transglycosylase MltG [Chitinophagaceae bacterium]